MNDRREEDAHRKGYRVTKAGKVVSPSGRILKPWEDSWGYLFFRPGRGKNVAVHRMIAFQKFGSRLYTQGLEVRHKDGDTLNLRQSNILLGTKTENQRDKPKALRLKVARIGASFLRKLTDRQVGQLRADCVRGMTYSNLARKYHIARSTVSYIVNRKTYSR
jgi:hypothetical protein